MSVDQQQGLGSIADKKACSGVAAANTGKLGCLSLFGTPTHLLAIAKGEKISANTIFNLDFLKQQIQKGIIIPLINASAFEDVSAEDSYSTNTSGIKRLNLKGLPEYKLMFEEGHEFYRELAKLEGYKNFDYIIGDDEGNWMMVVTSDNDYKGFTAGHTTPELTKRKQRGGDAESKSLLVQFLERLEWDRNYAIVHASELEFVPTEIPAVNGVQLDFMAVPTDGATTFQVRALLSSDNNTPVEGLLIDNFVIKVDGSTAVATVTSVSAGVYEFTLPALSTGETVVVDLWDGSLNVNVTESNDVLYRSDETSEVVSA